MTALHRKKIAGVDAMVSAIDDRRSKFFPKPTKVGAACKAVADYSLAEAD